MLKEIRIIITKIIRLTFLMLFFNCSSSKNVLIENNKYNLRMNYTNISNLLSVEEFEKIKRFILNKGDRKTYRNFDNDNPHYELMNFDLFLGADIGQRNINNDPEISDFNQLTIADEHSEIRYYELIIVRKGDVKALKSWIRSGMKEEEVYLVDFYGKGLEMMKNNIKGYLKQLNKKIIETNMLYKKKQ